MHEIDGAGHAGGRFVSEDAALGRAPTVVTPEWLNAVQDEITNVIRDAGIDLDKSDSSQLLKGILQKLGIHNDDPDSHPLILKKIAAILGVAERGDGVPDLALNDGLLTGGFAGMRSTRDELGAIYEAPKYPAADLGVCTITPPIEASTLRMAPSCPFITHRGLTSRFIPVDIAVTLSNTPVALPLFRPVNVNGWGMLVWRYVGSAPMHAHLSGTLDVIMRSSNTAVADDMVIEPYLRLRAWDAPAFDVGESSGNQTLSFSTGAVQRPLPLSTYRGLNDYCRPIDASAIANANANTSIWSGSVQGYISSNSTAEALTLEEGGVAVGPEVRTTQWISVAAYQRRAMLFDFTGTSTRSRVQVKKADGTIYYDSQSEDITSRRIYWIPPDADQIRIYYSAPGDTAAGESLRLMSATTGGEYSYASGHWTSRSFAVDRDVTFWPGAEYALILAVDVLNGAVARSFGFRFQGGGLSFEFDASDMRKQIAERAYKVS